MEMKLVPIEMPDGSNVILGQSHFIKTVEDLHEALIQGVPGLRFGLAFCEASGPRLIRFSGTNEEMMAAARKACADVAAGHFFAIFLRDAFPINVLNSIKMVPEVCHIFCATANPLQVIVVESEGGRGVAGVIDGQSPLGEESEEQQVERREFLRMIGYKL
ncbi:adenosine-specific kinase [Gemmatimonadota bacterium]